MKIKDMPQKVSLGQFKVKLPEDVYKKSSLPHYGINNVPVYFMGWTMGDFFVKVDIKSNQIYPMFWNKIPSGLEEWDVLES